MMNNKVLLNEINTLLTESIEKLPEKLVFKLQDLNGSSICLYDNFEKNAQDKIMERINNNSQGVIILRTFQNLPSNLDYYVAKENKWQLLNKLIADYYFPYPENLKIIGITGTNGKTTTTDLFLQMGEMMGKKIFSIGTLGIRSNGKVLLDFHMTTPPYLELRKYLCEYGHGREYCVMEVSSHSLAQNRMGDIKLSSAAWTNITQDHLDYHKTMENYFEAKSKILKLIDENGALFVPSRQTSLIEKLKKESKVNVIARDYSSLSHPFFKSLFNQENLELAYNMWSCLEKNMLHLIDLSRLNPPPGRFYIKEWTERVAIVDYAHTPDALKNICTEVRRSFPKHKIKLLFGCGGDRDKSKRVVMGQVAEECADEIILTSDNPRSEEPDKIIQDILVGINKSNDVIVEVDRPKAVFESLQSLKRGQLLIIAGKGHETGIQMKNKKIHYSDLEELDKFVSRIENDKA